MILTVTLNPLLERRFTFSSINLSSVNRGGKLVLKPGGKGINVSRQLSVFSLPNLAFSFFGGLNGKMLKSLLEKENIKCTFLKSAYETREASIILNESDRTILTFFSEDPQITSNEADGFLDKLKKIIQTAEIVILSGSSPCRNTDHVYPEAIKIANRFDKITICDTYGAHLKDCIESAPTIIHNNIDEINSSLENKPDSESGIINFLDYLYSHEIKQAFITDGGKDSYASNFDYFYKVKNAMIETVDETGSGDAFVAGIAYGWYHNYSFEMMLRFASAFGTLNAASFDVCNVQLNEAGKIIDKINISPLGKKMNLLDVTPK
ncbi:MAG: tagatose-6-phosphate kinase [Ignavibacteriaceae bacterium]